MPQVMTIRLILIKDCEVGNAAEMYNAGLFYGPVFFMPLRCGAEHV